jgi:hypothetical protein
MIKSLVGALLGALSLSLIVSVSVLLMGWLGSPASLLVVAGIAAVGGAILGWVRPRLFIRPILFFLDPSVFD